jgi:hypothetical protein
MVKTIFSGVWRIGRATALILGLAMMLAMVLGLASVAFGADGDAWRLGRANVATAITTLAGPLGVNGPIVRLVNNNTGTNDTALELRVQTGEAPMRVNSSTRVDNFNADQLDGQDSTAFLGESEKAADADKLDNQDSGDFVTRGQFSNVPGGVFRHPLNFHSYFMDTSAVQDYPFGQMKLQTTGIPGQFKVCRNGSISADPVNFVVYVNGVRTAGTYAAGCSSVFDAGAGGEFRVSARRAQVFGVHSGDSTTNENYSLIGFDQLG